MPTPTSALSSYRSGARALAAKSALPVAAGAAALFAPAAHAGVVVTIPTSGNVAQIGSGHTAFGVNFFNPTTPTSYSGFPAAPGVLTIYNESYGSGDGIRAALGFSYANGDYVGRFADASATNNGSSYPALLAPGTTIDASTFFKPDSFPYLNPGDLNLASVWANKTGYIAVELFNNSNTYYGWLKLQVNSDASHISLLALAYNDTPGASIQAGEGLAPVPEPATSAALLALGAAGLVAYRRRKNLQRAS